MDEFKNDITKVKLTKKEKEFIKNHKVIRVHNEKNWPPFNFFEFGQAKGYSIDLMNLVAKNTGLNIEYKSGPTWNDFLEMMKKDELDVMLNIVKSEEREKYMLFTNPFLNALHGIAVHKDNKDIKSFDDIIKNKKTVSLEKGFYYHEYFEKNYPDIPLKLVDNGSQTLTQVSYKNADATLGILPVMSYLADKNYITNLKFFGDSNAELFKPIPLRFAVRDDLVELHSILQKGLSAITPSEYTSLSNKWLGSLPKKYDDTNSSLKEIKLIDVLPLKEIFIIIIIFVLIIILMLKYLKKRKDVSLGISSLIVTLLFLFLTVIMTFITIKNLENVEKLEIKNSIQTILNITHKAFSEWIETQRHSNAFITQNSFDLNIIEKLVKNEKNKEYLISHQQDIQEFNKDVKNSFRNKDEFLIISKNFIVLSSSNESIIGSKIENKNLRKIIEKAFIEGTSISIPFQSKNPLEKIFEKLFFINTLKDKSNKAIAVYATGMNLNTLQKIAHQGRFGKSGETYIINQNTQFISQSRFEDNSKLQDFSNNKVAYKDNLTLAAKELLDMKNGFNIKGYKDYRGEDVFGAWIWNEQFNFGIITEVDKKEAIKPLNDLKKAIYSVVFSIVGFTLHLMIFILWFSNRNKKLLEAKNNELKYLLDSFDENVIASKTNTKGIITYASKAFCKISGFTQKELIGSPQNIVRHPDMPKTLFADLWSTISSGQTWRGEVKNRKKDGGYYWVDVVVEPEFDENEKIIGYSAIRQDITSKKEVEDLSKNLEIKVNERTKELEVSQKRFITLFDAAPDSIIIISNGKIIDCNQKTLELFGVESRLEFNKYSLSDLSPKYQENEIKSDILALQYIQQAINKGFNQFEWKHKRVDNHKTFDAEVILATIKIADEIYLYGVVRDISQRKELERQIRENQEQMTYVSQHANLGFWNFNPQIGDLYVNDVFVQMLGYDSNEVLANGYENKMFKPFKDGLAFWEQLLHPDDAKSTGEVLMAHINGQTELYNVEYRMRRADGTWMWSRAVGRIAEHDKDGKPIRFNGVNIDIDDAKKAQEEIEDQKQYTESIMNSQNNIVISTNGIKLRTANKAFLDFFEVKDVGEFLENIGDCICDTFDTKAPEEFLQKMMGEEKWIEYVYNRPDVIHKAIIEKFEQKHIFSITSDRFEFAGETLEVAVFTDISELEKIREEIEAVHKHTQSSIEYASLIQHSLIPSDDLFNRYFNDYFTIWHPKDIVGGDIYLFEELRNENECLLMVIDCTGHGVPGAFVTMLVKAIERQVAAIIASNKNIEVSPAWILKYFNQTMKKLLKQENDEAISNAGFDGAVLYYNKKEQIIRFAGAELPLFYIEDGNIKTIKGNRHSVGYKKSDFNYEFKEHLIEAKEGMQFYLVSDGYLDQNGGEKGFPFGKKRFQKILEENQNISMNEQKDILLSELNIYQGEEERNDDISVVGIKITKSKSEKIDNKNENWII